MTVPAKMVVTDTEALEMDNVNSGANLVRLHPLGSVAVYGWLSL
jgi:hypothetical protein